MVVMGSSYCRGQCTLAWNEALRMKRASIKSKALLIVVMMMIMMTIPHVNVSPILIQNILAAIIADQMR